MLTVHDLEETYHEVSSGFRSLRFRVEGTPPTSAVVCGIEGGRIHVCADQTRLWVQCDQRTGHDYDILWPTGPLPSLAVMPVLSELELRAAPREVDARWWSHWAGWAVDGLAASPRSPLGRGWWSIERVEEVGPSRRIPLGANREKLSVGAADSPFIPVATSDPRRMRVWQEWGRDHPTPPGLSYDVGVDVVLDGHHRVTKRFLRLRREDRHDQRLDGARWNRDLCRELERGARFDLARWQIA